ncbi:dihydroorotate dehydrogenase [Ruixingdingia sedimenti]|uniref:Dihydroorotate dehydrogenase n=1 Tax=Ruixingdingia sedimenti TaxID=3073604 RepID=A0ABU1F5A8_9RHOB|nr:dihydroorotate dehydrogenase [Xinfangfangia sp. LG-4]MDR5652019.1 dihydroorotate dehydrogenase [Xinfangfangia sp. LG-4]
MTMRNDLDDRDLDSLFAAAREGAPTDALMARVLADAAAHRPRAAAPPVAVAPARRSWWAALAGGFGGYALAGLGAAALAGLWIGFAVPAAYESVGSGAEMVELIPDETLLLVAALDVEG